MTYAQAIAILKNPREHTAMDLLKAFGYLSLNIFRR